MKSDSRISGIDIIGNIPWGTHFCLFYQTKQDLMEILIPYFKAGLENNEFCIWVISEPFDEEEAKEALRDAVPDFDTYLEKGQIEVIPYTRGYLRDDVLDFNKTLNEWIERTNQILDVGYDGLRLSGNSFWLETHFENFVLYKEEVDSVIGKFPIIPLCTYCLDKCNVTGIAEIVSNHQFSLAKKGGKWEKIENFGRKRAEEAEINLKQILCKLEYLIKERTEELEKAYNSLKEREEGLAESQEIAHIGNWELDFITNKMYWSDELYRIFGRNQQQLAPSRNEFLNYVHPEDRDYINNIFYKAMIGEPYSVDYRILLPNGEERILHMKSEIIHDEKNNPIRIKGIVQDITEYKLALRKLQMSEEKYRSFIHNFKGIAFQLDENLIPEFVHGAVEEITGYTEKDFMTAQVWWIDIIHIEDRPIIQNEVMAIKNYPIACNIEFEYRIKRKDGKIKWIHELYQKIIGKNREPVKYQGAVYDITAQKEAERTLNEIREARIKEIHHRIKNNLQVISSLLSLQAEKFNDAEVLEAFKESQNRVGSMALIHEELYKGYNTETLNFADYLLKLTTDLLNSYRVGRDNISLKLDLEQVSLGIDTAIPLGIIVNELVSNSLKHAFPNRQKGEIRISLQRPKGELNKKSYEAFENKNQKRGFDFILKVSDNGVGIPVEIDFQNADTLGLQLVNILVEQIDGCLEVKSDKGTEFSIWFNNLEA